MINSENFNSFTIVGILEKLNDFISTNHIKRCDIISLSVCRDGSVTLFYYDK